MTPVIDDTISPRIRLGVTIPVLNNWIGMHMAVNTLTTKHELRYSIIDNGMFRLPLATAWNLGVSNLFAKGCDYVLVSNDDVLFSPHTVDALVARAQRGDVALVSAWNVRGLVEKGEEILDFAVPDQINEPPHPDFSCFLITPECWEKVGMFDENFIPAYCEDNDYHARIVFSGLHAIQTTAAPYFHFGGVTRNIAVEGEVPPDVGDLSRAYFQVKWGHQPVSHPDEMWNVYYRNPFNDLRFSLREWPDPKDVRVGVSGR